VGTYQVANGNPALGEQLSAFHSWTGKANVIVNLVAYPIDPTGAPNNPLFGDLTTIWDNGAVPTLTWGQNVENVKSGLLDSELTAFATAIKQWLAGPDGKYGTSDDRRIYFRYDWEMNGSWFTDWSPCASNGPSEGDYVTAWHRVHDLFASHGLDNTHVAWIFSANANSSCTAGDPASLYPGPGYVDWLGVDGYSESMSQLPSDLFTPMVTELRGIDSTKPAGINEVGVDSSLGTTAKNQWISDYFAYLTNNNIETATWFNENFGNQAQEWAVLSQVYPANPKILSVGPLLSSWGDQTFPYTWHSAVPSEWQGFSAYSSGVHGGSIVGSCGDSACISPRVLSDQQFLGQ
jgi:hypothetical protein